MAKSIAASILFALISASIIALPGFAPEVEAGEAVALAIQETGMVQSAAVNCLNEVWPNLPASCLQRTGSAGKITEARLVTTRR